VPVAPVAAPSLHTLLYTTRRGDTLVSIADRFGVSLDQLRRWNKIPSGIKVEPGRRLHVAEPAAVRRSSTTRHHESVSRGGDPPPAKESARHKTQGKAQASTLHAQSQTPKHSSAQKLYKEKQK
jgi:membrane-bound lytic murein transglycosylase D